MNELKTQNGTLETPQFRKSFREFPKVLIIMVLWENHQNIKILPNRNGLLNIPDHL